MTISFTIDSSSWGNEVTIDDPFASLASGPFDLFSGGRVTTDANGDVLAWRIFGIGSGEDLFTIRSTDGSGNDNIGVNYADSNGIWHSGLAIVRYAPGSDISNKWKIKRVPDAASSLLLLVLSLVPLCWVHRTRVSGPDMVCTAKAGAVMHFSAGVLAMLLTQAASGGLIVNATEEGDSVLFRIEAGGSLDLSAWSKAGPRVDPNVAHILPRAGRIAVGSGFEELYSPIEPIITPDSYFGPGDGATAYRTEGGHFRFEADAGIGVPLGYVSGETLDVSSAWFLGDFTSLGLVPGSYTWMWRDRDTADFLTLNIQAVPEGGYTMTMLGLALSAAGLIKGKATGHKNAARFTKKGANKKPLPIAESGRPSS